MSIHDESNQVEDKSWCLGDKLGNQIVKNVMMESKVRKRVENMSLFERPEIVTLEQGVSAQNNCKKHMTHESWHLLLQKPPSFLHQTSPL